MALSTEQRGNFQRQINEMKKAINILEEAINSGGETEPITSDSITDATTVGKSVLTAEDAAAARTAIGAGTSNLVLGSGASQAAAGNHTHSNYATTGALADLEARVTALEGAGG